MIRTLKLINSKEIRDEIALMGYTEQAFARKIGIRSSNLSLYLNEKRYPSITSAKKIADGLNAKVKDIFTV